MNASDPQKFFLPDTYLAGLPTGAVKDVVDTLGARIAKGVYIGSDTIPMEAELMSEFDVSRTVIREAIKVLSGKGLVQTARRYGTRVRPFENWRLLDPDVIRWHDPDSPAAVRIYTESTELRQIVEPEAAALAARNATDAQRDTILLAAQSIHPEPYGEDAMIAADYMFHATILEATGNIMLRQLQVVIQALLQFSYPTGTRAAPEEKITSESHVEVAEAIRAGDASLAREKMRAMLETNQVVADRIK